MVACTCCTAEQVKPLLVVCFTNHALDSFLESLLDLGIDSIVRVGNEAKTSERLQPFNLKNRTPPVREMCCIPGLFKVASKQRANELIYLNADACTSSLQALLSYLNSSMVLLTLALDAGYGHLSPEPG
jgi:hypothetical protein